jgi:hypothetical protein
VDKVTEGTYGKAVIERVEELEYVLVEGRVEIR